MQTIINGIPFRIEFNFAPSSFNKVITATELFSAGTPFVIYTADEDFMIYLPRHLTTICKQSGVMVWRDVTTMQVQLGIDLMLFDFVSPLSKVLGIEGVQKLLNND